MLIGVLINVASGNSNPNRRGRIFNDRTFEYLPLPETRETTEKVPTYREIGFSNVQFPDLRAHLDPEFNTFTYGHIERGFGDIKSLNRLAHKDLLIFYATLQRESQWWPFIIGYFSIREIIDCRKLSTEEIFALKSEGFQNNAHLKRVNPHVDFLIKGDDNSKLMSQAFPLAEERDPLVMRAPLKDIIFTSTGKRIENGKPWYRWTMLCTDTSKLLDMLSE